MELHTFRPTDNAALRTAEQNRAFTAATRLKADVDAARAEAGEERFISTPADLKELSSRQTFTQTKLTALTQVDGELHGLVKNDSNRAFQYRMSRGIAAGMMGGMMGGILQSQGTDIYTRATVGTDGVTRVESLGIEQSSGLMNYSEYQMPF